MSESATSEALRYCVRIMNALNDIVHFVYASVCMNWKTGGGDAQLDAAVAHLQKLIKDEPRDIPPVPKTPVKAQVKAPVKSPSK
jgi:hypothetical protein